MALNRRTGCAKNAVLRFVKIDRITGLKADISNLEPVHVATASTAAPRTDPIDSGFKRAVADGDLGRSFRVWAHTFVSKSDAVESGLLAASGEAESDWAKPAARFQNFLRRLRRPKGPKKVRGKTHSSTS